ncbi:hypothetical protein [Klebsiella pneumoniae]|uniref:hypothetical protein n=1 Tax=Klebsiella pneumoniae TaxID=573 RepID=UPI00138F1187|nr:hypothetical protein [Klebsiella pneumoniae]MBL4317341.1 hypothetical protein [Klebsiella pneumoniae]MCQ0571729.1 hypothetical protein [Klebsiella pneumoniae]HDE2091507.1 hypothetical protein [Klebsiella pneumoniae]HDZ0633762.1 hypothetical protein [Klebsiella pneumoniae]
MAGIAAVSFLVKTVIKIPLNKGDQCKSPVDNAALLYCRALSVASSNGSYQGEKNAKINTILF